MSKTFYQYLQEKEMEFYDNPKVTQKVPDVSDKPHGAEDYTYSNSDMQSFYSRGNGFDLEDNQEFYEIVKSIKDLTDKHLFVKNVTWKVNIKGRKAFVVFNFGKDVDETNEFFIKGFEQHLLLRLFHKFKDFFKIDNELVKNEENEDVLKIYITKISDKVKDMRNIVVPASNTFISKQSSISQM